VGLDVPDDAAVYQLAPDLAVVQTVDFITPLLDNPRDWGRVAAANALSDVYAMGGQPILCLNVVAWPRDTLSLQMLAEVMAGGRSIVESAGAVVAGGHSIDDAEPKYGLCVTGVVHPNHIFRSSAARPGDDLVITKPVGTGILLSAMKQGELDDTGVIAEITESMAGLNDEAAREAHSVGCQAVTDVSGFGLLGHLLEMLIASACGAELYPDAVPMFRGVRALAEKGLFPGGSQRNAEWVEPLLLKDPGIDEATLAILSDAQTSGGLLICWPHGAPNPPGAVIGVVVDGPVGKVSLRR
jgi:selenide,water dikinase